MDQLKIICTLVGQVVLLSFVFNKNCSLNVCIYLLPLLIASTYFILPAFIIFAAFAIINIIENRIRCMLY